MKRSQCKSTRMNQAVLVTICMFGLAFLGACKPFRQNEPASSVPGGLPPGSPAPSVPLGGKGTADGGGGNTFEGRPLESYVVKVESLPA